MRRRLRIWWRWPAFAVFTVALSAPAHAQLDPADTLCRQSIGKGVRRLADTIVRQSAACHRRRLAGREPAAVDCNDPQTLPGVAAVNRTITALTRLALRRCLGGTPAENGYVVCPAPCSAVPITADYGTVANCLVCVARDQARATLEAAYGAPPAPASAPAQACQNAVGRGLRSYLVRAVKEQQRCQKAEDEAPAGIDCRTADPRARVERARQRAESLIARCDDAVLATLDSCAADVGGEQTCVTRAVEEMAAVLFDAVYDPALLLPTPTPSATATSTVTVAPTETPVPAPTATATDTPVVVFTATETPAPTATETETPTETLTPTRTFTRTPTPTRTGTRTATETATPTETPSSTPTGTPPSFALQLTAHRPLSESYGAPFQRQAVPEAAETSPGAGIRINGDDDDNDGVADRDDSSVAGENDLIEVSLAASPALAPPGYEYVLARTQPNLRVWSASTKSTAILDGNDEQVVVLPGGALTIWVENHVGGSATLELLARPAGGGATLASDAIHFQPFTSVVIALGGEGQVPSDPPSSNHGVFNLAASLYAQGYDVHMYDEDDVGSNGSGAAYNEVVSAVQRRGVAIVSIFGYSHGGGSTYDLAERLDANRATIGSFSFPYTAYIDAIENDSDVDLDAERRLPPTTAYHVNYYQRSDFLIRGNSVAGADVDVNVNDTPWGGGLNHTAIDDHANVRSGVLDPLLLRVSR